MINASVFEGSHRPWCFKVEFIGVNQRFFEELQAIAEDKIYYQTNHGETVGKLITFMGIPIKIIEDLPYNNVVFGEVVFIGR